MEDVLSINWLALLAAAVVPLLIGFIWYHEKLMGAKWMKEAAMTPEKIQTGNMGLIFGVTFVFSFLLAFGLNFTIIHQWGLFGTLLGRPDMSPDAEEFKIVRDLMSKYGTNFRSFGHGAMHGSMYGLLFALPILGINALFERKSWTYILIHLGFWVITLGIMSGIISVWI